MPTPANFNTTATVNFLQQELPGCLAIYLFGSVANNSATAASDIDIAVLFSGNLPATRLWTVGNTLATQLGQDVDLVDLKKASTVLQNQVLQNGLRIFVATDAMLDVECFELFVLSEYLAFQESRAALLAQIHHDGRILGEGIQRG